jgi:hypothetical protein
MIGHSNRRRGGHKEAAIDAAMKNTIRGPTTPGGPVKTQTKFRARTHGDAPSASFR